MTIHKAIICAVAFSFFLGCASHRVVALKVTDEQGIPVSDALVMQVECAMFCRYTPFFRGWFMAWRDHTPYYAWIEKNRFEYHYHPYVLVGVTDANGLVHLPLHRLDTIRFELFSVEWGLYAWSYAIRIHHSRNCLISCLELIRLSQAPLKPYLNIWTGRTVPL